MGAIIIALFGIVALQDMPIIGVAIILVALATGYVALGGKFVKESMPGDFSEATLEPVAESVVYSLSFWKRLENSVYFGLAWGIGIWLFGVFSLEEVLPQWTPAERSGLSGLLATPVALLLGWRRFSGRYYKLIVNQHNLCIVRGNRRRIVELADVQGLVGLSGISLEGGELIVWKYLLVLTELSTYVLALGPEMNRDCYRALRDICPYTWGLPFRGSLEEPIMPETHRQILERIQRHLRKEFGKSFLSAIFLLASSSLIFIGLAFEGALIPKLVLYLVIGSVLGVLLMMHALRLFPVLRAFRRRVNRGRPPEFDSNSAGGKNHG